MNQESIIFNLLQCQEYLLDEQQIKYTKEQQLQKVKDLVANLIVKYKSFVNQIEIEDQVYLITIPMEVHNQICTIQFELLLNFKCNENDYRVILTDSSGRIIVKEKNIRISLSRYMLRLNTGLRIGSFYIHPLNGYIGFKLQCQSEQGLLFIKQNQTTINSLIILIPQLKQHSIPYAFTS